MIERKDSVIKSQAIHRDMNMVECSIANRPSKHCTVNSIPELAYAPQSEMLDLLYGSLIADLKAVRTGQDIKNIIKKLENL